MSKTQHQPEAIGKYKIEKMLGRGAMGVVYKGVDAQIERHVAIKVLHPHLREGAQGQDLEQRFLQEAKAAARCLHTNIVTIFDFGSEAEGNPYIVMEYVEGVELKAHLQSDMQISLPSAVDITIQVLEALSHAHAKGIVHRDIKPANIILLEDGTVKVSDFGVARLDTSDLTSTGFMVGTPNYMSPEGLQGMQVDSRSDLYSVGVLFYELVTRRRPLRGMGLEESLEPLDTLAHLSVQNINSIKPIIRRALQPLTEVRFQSAAEFIGKLKTIDDMDLTEAQTAFFPTQNAKAATAPEQRASLSSASQISSDILDSLEQSLAKYVGPMARVLVRKNSKSSQNIEELSMCLAQHIPTESERGEFIRNLERTGITQVEQASTSWTKALSNAGDNVASTPNQSSAALSEAQIDQLTKLLTFYVGPLAGRLVKKSTKRITDPKALFEFLSQQIPDKKEQSEFLKKTESML